MKNYTVFLLLQQEKNFKENLSDYDGKVVFKQ